jgi:hypothetical protein
MKRRFQRIPFLLILSSYLLSSCAGGANNASKQATLDAISASVRLTATVVAAQQQNPNAPIETAQAEATAFSQSVDATQAALGALSVEDQAATTSAIAPILAELPTYGVDPAAGRVGWIHPPVTLEVEGFMQFDYINHFIATLASDFVLSADITWDAIGAASGCGFVLRSDGKESALNQYLTIMTRVASGHILFATMAEGEVVTGQDIFAQNSDPNFDWQNESTNRLTVVGRGNRFWIYTNGSLIGEIDPSAPPLQPNLPPEPEEPVDTSNAEAMANFLQQQAEFEIVSEQIQADFRARRRALQNADTTFERGFMAFVALSQSGRKTVCQYNNAWLWLIE